MSSKVVGIERGPTVLAILHAVELLLMLLLEVNVVHLPTSATFLDVAAAVTKVSGNLGLGELLVTVVTTL